MPGGIPKTAEKTTWKGKSVATENKDKAVLHYPGGEYEMDIMHATEGNDGVVLGKFLSLIHI